MILNLDILADKLRISVKKKYFVSNRFIKILELVIDEPGNEFKTFTPNIIVLAVEQIYPIVSEVITKKIKCKLKCSVLF